MGWHFQILIEEGGWGYEKGVRTFYIVTSDVKTIFLFFTSIKSLWVYVYLSKGYVGYYLKRVYLIHNNMSEQHVADSDRGDQSAHTLQPSTCCVSCVCCTLTTRRCNRRGVTRDLRKQCVW